jgi:hypothetical protein
MNTNRLGSLGGTRGLLCLIALALFVIQSAGMASTASTTTTTHTRVRVTTTATVTETTTATGGVLGSRPFLVLLVLLGTAACVAVVGGYVWGKKRTRKDLLGAST